MQATDSVFLRSFEMDGKDGPLGVLMALLKGSQFPRGLSRKREATDTHWGWGDGFLPSTG